jgi:hypothetical protein
MDATTLLITVYCLVDEWLADRRLRQRGPQPILSDSEVLTIECVGEFLGIDTDKGRYEHLRRHWAAWFPALRQVHRTTFIRQAANLWAVKYRLHQHLLAQVKFDPSSAWSTAWPCRSADSPAPTGAGGYGSWPPGATMRSPSRPTWGCAPICGCAGQE